MSKKFCPTATAIETLGKLEKLNLSLDPDGRIVISCSKGHIYIFNSGKLVTFNPTSDNDTVRSFSNIEKAMDIYDEWIRDVPNTPAPGEERPRDFSHVDGKFLYETAITFRQTHAKLMTGPDGLIRKRLLEAASQGKMEISIPMDNQYSEIIEELAKIGVVGKYVGNELQMSWKTPIASKKETTVDEYFEMVKTNGLLLKDVPVEKRTYNMCLAAVKQNGDALEHVPKEKVTEDMCFDAVIRTGHALKYVPNEKRTINLCSVAVKQNQCAFEFVPSEIIQSVYYSIAPMKNVRK